MALGPSRKATRQGNFRYFEAHILIGFVNRQLVISSINSKLLPVCTKLLPRNILQLSVGFSVLRLDKKSGSNVTGTRLER